jgi:hypothetical protein
MGPGKVRNAGECQSVLIMIDPIISLRTRNEAALGVRPQMKLFASRAEAASWALALLAAGGSPPSPPRGLLVHDAGNLTLVLG